MTTDLMHDQRSRRGLLAAAAAAVAGAVAASVTRISPAQAADGDPVTVGGGFEGSRPTSFTTSATNALEGTSQGSRGVQGISTSGQGVHGSSVELAGVAGVSEQGAGVHGTSQSNRGVWGESTDGVGAVGSSESNIGVAGRSDRGPGVEGTGAIGVNAAGTIGVQAEGSTAVAATSAFGYALHTANGRLRFDGISGVAVIQAGQTEVVVEPGVPIEDNTFVLLSPMTNLNGRSFWYVPNKGAGTIAIKMEQKRSKNAKIAYLIAEFAPRS